MLYSSFLSFLPSFFRIRIQVCNILPKDIAAECDTIVSTYGPELIQDLVKYAELMCEMYRW